MSNLPLLKPGLYSVCEGRLVLQGGQCGECDYVFFPLNHYGCERCGAAGTALRPATLTATGELMSSAVVHLHNGESRKTPFVVASIKLTDGPFIRTLLDCDPDRTLSPGQALRGVLVPVDNSAQEARQDLRFTPT